MFFFKNSVMANYDKVFYDFKIESISGKIIDFNEYKNKVVLIVNTASYCGFTKQYEELQELWNIYKSKGLIVLGVPSNSFNQEPGSNDEVKNFCEAKFGINFPMTEKVDVKGENAHPFYKWANENYGKKTIPKWNFHKIIIGKNGKVYDTFASITKPTSKKFIKSLEEALKE